MLVIGVQVPPLLVLVSQRTTVPVCPVRLMLPPLVGLHSVRLLPPDNVAVPPIVGVVQGTMAVKVFTTGIDVPPALLAIAVTEFGPAANVRLAQA